MSFNRVSSVLEEKNQQSGLEGWENNSYSVEDDDELTSLSEKGNINIMESDIKIPLDLISHPHKVTLDVLAEIKEYLDVHHSKWNALWLKETGEKILFYTKNKDLVDQSALSKDQIILMCLANKFHKIVHASVYHKIISNDTLKRDIYPIIERVYEKVLCKNKAKEPRSYVSTFPLSQPMSNTTALLRYRSSLNLLTAPLPRDSAPPAVPVTTPAQSSYSGVLFSSLPTSPTTSTTTGTTISALTHN